MAYVPLHLHTHYSLLDGLGTPKKVVNAAKELGCPAVALTDHGVLYGAVEFYKAAKDAGIKPIIGCEVYVAPASRFDRTSGSENKPFHLVLLATNNEGYKNLMYLVTKANLEGFYYKPRVDHGLLKAHSSGLIALSACLASEVARSILEGNESKQLEVIGRYQDIFGKKNFFLELQHHPFIEEQKPVNDRIKELAKLTGAPLVATLDSHYIHQSDAQAQDILLCIQTQSTLSDKDRMRFEGDFSLVSDEKFREIFSDVPEAVENTLRIAEMCDLKMELGQSLIPVFKTPNSIPAGEYLRELCMEGMNLKYGKEVTEQVVKQLDYELKIVDNMGFNDYFLIVWDFVKFAKDAGITVGPGRGSAAGSLITYCLDITELDPIKYGLIFERFLNPERVSMPDIDIDFADNRRNEVLDYVRKKYGIDNVAQIITFGTMAARAAVRDVGRAMGYPYAEVDRVAKLIPPPVQGKHIPLDKSIKEDPELKKIYESESRTKELLDNAIKLEGTVRHAGTHASAVVMSELALVNYTPLQRSTSGSDDIITQYSMKPIEDIGLLKMDFLGLKNLTIIQRTLELIVITRAENLNLRAVPMDDASTFDLFQRGDTTGVFQLESAGMRRYIRELRPTRFEDIIAMISLYRPGPMEWIPGYIKARHNPETIRYFHPSFEVVLRETNGVAIYQEQILQLARNFAGFSLGEADLLRKAVGKKIPALLQEQKAKFVDGAAAQGHDKNFAIEVFEKVIEPFAGYGFNKAHAACYAMISYRTAYLKAHYPTEFMAALLTSDNDNTERIAIEIMECEEMGIAVLPPSVNESYASFTVVSDRLIRFGLSAIKGLSNNAIQDIIAARVSGGPFKNLEDLLQRVSVKSINKKTIECLAYGGALDAFGERKAIVESVEDMVKYAKNAQETASHFQGSLFGGIEAGELSHFTLKKITPQSIMEKLNSEKEYLGLYVSGHPLKGLTKYLKKKVNLIDSLTQKQVGKSVKIGGLLNKSRKVFTKSGSYMMYGEIEDPTGRIEIVVFPKVFNLYQQAFVDGAVVIMEGRLDERNGNLQFSCNVAKAVSLDSMIANAKKERMFDENEKVVRKVKILDHEKESKTAEVFMDRPIVPEPDNTQWQQNPYQIYVEKNIAIEKLRKLKLLLLGNPGEQGVELILADATSEKKIRLPMQIQLTDELEKEISEVIR